MKHRIEPTDILAMTDYARLRRDKRREMIALKEKRRLSVGPYVTVHFECFATIWQQIHEMLYIEKGGAEQVPGELAAYNPLVPNGRELVATVMFEVEDDLRRHRLLSSLGGVEKTMSLRLDGEEIRGMAETDVDRTSASGKASSVQFLHFPFTPGQVGLFRQPGRQVVFAIAHPHYQHMTVVPEEVRATLAGDFD